MNQSLRLSTVMLSPIMGGKRMFSNSSKTMFSKLDFQPIVEKENAIDETAQSALDKSCYKTINWTISENAKVIDAIQRMVAHKIGALAVTAGDGDNGEVIGLISERDYLCKIGFLNRTSRETSIKEICTYGKANLVSVTRQNPIDDCMRKMLDRNVRHLLIREKETEKIIGLISVKDIVKCTLAKHDAVVNKLTEMVVVGNIMKQI